MECSTMDAAAGGMAIDACSVATESTVASHAMELVPAIEPRGDTQRPAMQLSLHLIDTYTRINQNYYKKRNLTQDGFPRRKRNGVAKEDKGADDYHFQTREEIFHGRYRVFNKKLGTGSFGQVVHAIDLQENMEVAIKIVKRKKNFTSQAQTEISILESLKGDGHIGQQFMIHLLDTFVHKEHQCLVFEKLSINLYELLKKTKFLGVGLKLLRKLTWQILQGLDYLAQPSVNIVHCDLKPENILLIHQSRSGLKLIDFGSSCLSHEQMYQYIQSRFYRSPEVLLGMKYTTAIDAWSLGCILVEMHTGKPLFGGLDQHDQLRRISNVLGVPPREMLENANPQYRKQFFDEIVVSEGENRLIDYRLKLYKSTSTEDPALGGEANSPTTLAEILGVETGGPGGRRMNKPDHSPQDYRLFLDLIERLLDYNPATRITPAEALKHPFFTAYNLVQPSDSKKFLRSHHMLDFYSTESEHSMYVESNMDRIKLRRLHDTRGSIH